MQGFLRRWYGRTAAVVTALLLAAQSLLAAINPGREGDSGQRKLLDGRSLYMALFQGRGPALQFIPVMSDEFRLEYVLSAEQIAEVTPVLDTILTNLDEKDHNFFLRFSQAVKSHDHQTIRLAMIYGSALGRERGRRPPSPAVSGLILPARGRSPGRVGKFDVDSSTDGLRI